MGQHDGNIANQSRTNFRQDLNNALAAILSQQSGPGDPAIIYPYEVKIDTSVSPAVVYIRNAANSAWRRYGYIDASTGQLIMDDATNADTVDNKHYSDFSDKLVHDVTLAGTDTYTGTLPTGVSDYYDKMKCAFVVPNANTATNPTINLSSKGAKKVLDRNGAAIAAGDLPAGKAVCEYDSAADSNNGGFLLLNPKATSGKISGDIVKTAYFELTSSSTTNASIPHDDSIPQNTEGYELPFSTMPNITPEDANNILEIEAHLEYADTATADHVVMALFQDSGADAVRATCHNSEGVNGPCQVDLFYKSVAGSTSNTVFKLRIGGQGATITVNGYGGNRMWGGALCTWVKITEKKPTS